jgi:two-component system cell cycle sensor histidine kinase/response regulator CckA
MRPAAWGLTNRVRFITLIRSLTHKAMKTVDEFSPPASTRAGSAALVLVVDDEDAVRRFACRVLDRAGFGVLEATDGVQALELIQSRRGGLEAVVSDIVMPRMNGVELMQALASSDPDLPVILMSGYATEALTDMGIAAPCSIIPKPFTAERLLAEVSRCIRRSDGGSSAA